MSASKTCNSRLTAGPRDPGSPELLGGKAYGLWELERLGLPIPRWIALTTNAAESVLRPLHARIGTVLRDLPGADTAALKRAAHEILDNYATHKTPEVAQWLRRHPRVHFHFTPTSASWLNLVERFFSELTTRQLRRLAVTSVVELEAAIHHYIAHRNADPRPFTWTASVSFILAKVRKAHETLASLH